MQRKETDCNEFFEIETQSSEIKMRDQIEISLQNWKLLEWFEVFGDDEIWSWFCVYPERKIWKKKIKN